MSWSESLTPEIYNYFLLGPENKERIELFGDLLRKYASDQYRCLQVGVPSWEDKKFGKNFTSIDLYDDRPCIDLCMDLHDLNFSNRSFDFIVCNAVLEHVKAFWVCSKEMMRVLKPGGELYVEVPFCQSYHPCNLETGGEHGGDYWRFTKQGLMELFSELSCQGIFLGDDGGIAALFKKGVL